MGQGQHRALMGFFGAKSVGSEMGARQLFGAGVVLSSCRDKCSILICRRIQTKMSFELKKSRLFGPKTPDT
jgi:hypothetical protein